MVAENSRVWREGPTAARICGMVWEGGRQGGRGAHKQLRCRTVAGEHVWGIGCCGLLTGGQL